MVMGIRSFAAAGAFVAALLVTVAAEAQYFIPNIVPNFGASPGTRVHHGTRSRSRQVMPQPLPPKKPRERTTDRSATKSRSKPVKPKPSSAPAALVDSDTPEPAPAMPFPAVPSYQPMPGIGGNDTVINSTRVAERKTAWGRWIAESNEHLQHFEISPSQITIMTASGDREVHAYESKPQPVDGDKVVVASVPFDRKDPQSGVRFYQFESRPSVEGVLALKIWLEVQGRMPFPPQQYTLHAMDDSSSPIGTDATGMPSSPGMGMGMGMGLPPGAPAYPGGMTR